MDKKITKVKNSFTSLIGHASKVYKEVSNITQESYLQGKREAYDEILNWFVSSHNGELKYVSATSLFGYLQEKITNVKSELLKINTEENTEDTQTMNFGEIKISDNKKRINKYAIDDPLSKLTFTGISNFEDKVQGTSKSNITFPFSINHMLNIKNQDENNTMSMNSNNANNTENQMTNYYIDTNIFNKNDGNNMNQVNNCNNIIPHDQSQTGYFRHNDKFY